MTTTISETGTESLEHLDFEFEPPCERGMDERYSNCDDVATWKVTFMCCGTIMVFCEEHILPFLVIRDWSNYAHGGISVTGILVPGCLNTVTSVRIDKL